MVAKQKSRQIVAAALVAGLGAAAATNCTLALDREPVQCETDPDCSDRGGDFGGTVCSGGTCVRVATVKAPDAGSGFETCSSSQECTVRLATPARCVAQTCIAITTAFCPFSEGDSSNEDAIYVGYLAPFSTDALFAENTFGAVQVAVRDYNAAIATIPGRRPLVAVACDEGKDPEVGIQYLVDSVRVKSFVGASYSDTLPRIRAAALPRNITIVDWITSGPGLPDEAVWSTNPARSHHIAVVNAELQVIQEQIMKVRPDFTTLRVSLLVSNEVDSLAFAEEFRKTALFNEKEPGALKTAEENRGEGNFDAFFYTDPYFQEGSVEDLEANAKLTAFATAEPTAGVANLVITTSNVLPAAAVLLDDNFPEFEPDLFHAFAPGGIPTIQGFKGSDPEFLPRAFAIGWARSPASQILSSAYRQSYRSKLDGKDPFPDTEYIYDGVLLNAYALEVAASTAGVKVEDVTPAQFGAAVRRLAPPPAGVGVNINDPRQVYQRLTGADSRIDLEGASNNLDFDDATHSPVVTAELLCMSKSKGAFQAAGITFDPTTGKAEGEFSCP